MCPAREGLAFLGFDWLFLAFSATPPWLLLAFGAIPPWLSLAFSTARGWLSLAFCARRAASSSRPQAPGARQDFNFFQRRRREAMRTAATARHRHPPGGYRRSAKVSKGQLSPAEPVPWRSRVPAHLRRLRRQGRRQRPNHHLLPPARGASTAERGKSQRMIFMFCSKRQEPVCLFSGCFCCLLRPRSTKF